MADSYEERAAEIAGRALAAVFTPGGASTSMGLRDENHGKASGAGARAFYNEVFQAVLKSLKEPGQNEQASDGETASGV